MDRVAIQIWAKERENQLSYMFVLVRRTFPDIPPSAFDKFVEFVHEHSSHE